MRQKRRKFHVTLCLTCDAPCRAASHSAALLGQALNGVDFRAVLRLEGAGEVPAPGCRDRTPNRERSFRRRELDSQTDSAA
jgi:hypothetical protein